jgi:Tesmin/TSO1-like CXC domain, cysteine-rich domain
VDGTESEQDSISSMSAVNSCGEEKRRNDDSKLKCSEDLPLLSSPSSEPPKASSLESYGSSPAIRATTDRNRTGGPFRQSCTTGAVANAPDAYLAQQQLMLTESKVGKDALHQSPQTADAMDSKHTDSVTPSKIQASPPKQHPSPKTNGSVVYPTPVRHAAARTLQASTPSSSSGNLNTTAVPPPTPYGWIPGGTPPHYHPHPMHMYHHPSPAIYASPDSSPWNKAGGTTASTGAGGSGTKQQHTPTQAPPIPYPWPPHHLPPYPYPPHPHHPYSGTGGNGSRYTQAHLYQWLPPHAPPSLNRTTKSKQNAVGPSTSIKSSSPTKFKIPSGSAKDTTKGGSAEPEDSARKGGALSPRQIALHHRVEVQDMGCTCKKTRCLKLYCQCFGVRVYCGTNCRCLQCYNTKKHEKHRKEAMRNILSRNPGAFDIKFKKDPTAAILVPPRPPVAAMSSVNIVQPTPPVTKSAATQLETGADVVPVKLETIAANAATDATEASRALAHRLGCKCRKSACMKKVRYDV